MIEFKRWNQNETCCPKSDYLSCGRAILVELDAEGCLTKIDIKALQREAKALKTYIETAKSSELALYGYAENLLPLVMEALSGTLTLPFKDAEPYAYNAIRNGWIPPLTPEFRRIYCRFVSRIRGCPIQSSCSVKGGVGSTSYVPDVVKKGGKFYEWVVFEE